MRNNSNIKITLEAPESNLIIEGYDMEFIVKRSANSDADSAYVTVWNLDDEIYNLIIQREQLFNLYIQYENNDIELLFCGYSDNNYTSRNRIEIIQTGNEPISPDIQTSIRLVESKKAFQNAYINEAYRDEVSAEQIIKDCISAMGLGNVLINTEIPEKYYSSFKAIGRPHKILYNICDSLGINVSIQNGIVNIGVPSVNNTEQDILVFDSSNSFEPQYQGNDEVLLITGLQTKVQPNSVIHCNFDNLQNQFRVLNVTLEGNNFDKPVTTYITIGLQTNE